MRAARTQLSRQPGGPRIVNHCHRHGVSAPETAQRAGELSP